MAFTRDAWTTFLLCAVGGALVIIDTLDYPTVKGQGFGQGPAFYPQLLALALIALGVLVLIYGLRRKDSKADAPSGESESSGVVRVRPMLPYTVLVLSIVLVKAMSLLGFFISGFLLIALTVLLIQNSLKPVVIGRGLLFSAGILLLAWLVFTVFIGIELPGSDLFGG